MHVWGNPVRSGAAPAALVLFALVPGLLGTAGCETVWPEPQGPTPVYGALLQIEGTLGAESGTCRSGWRCDSWEFDVVEGRRVAIYLSSAYFDPVLVVSTPDGQELGNDDRDETTRDSYVAFRAGQAGTVRVLVGGYGEAPAGVYLLTAVDAAAEGNTLNVWDPRIDGWQSWPRVDGVLSGDSDYSAFYVAPVAFFALPVVAGQWVGVVVETLEFDPRLVVVLPGSDTDRDQLARSAPSFPGPHNLQFVPERDGYVLVLVGAPSGSPGGNFALYATGASPVRFGGSFGPAPWTNWPSVRGALDPEDPTDESGRRSESWVLEVEAGRPISVRASAEFDLTLAVTVSPDGTALVSNDHFGSDPGIDFVPAVDGEVGIVVGSQQASQMGEYVLMVNEGLPFRPPETGGPPAAAEASPGGGGVVREPG